MKDEGDAVATSYGRAIKDFQAEVVKRSATENGGKALYLTWDSLDFVYEENQELEGNRFIPRITKYRSQRNGAHSIPILPNSGLTVLRIHPSEPTMELRDGTIVPKPVGRILFRLDDLYVLGYFCIPKNKWRLMDDVNLEGLISDSDHVYVEKMGFTSSYGRNGMNANCNDLTWGQPSMDRLYETVTNFRGTREEKKAMATSATTLSEAMRRFYAKERATNCFREERSEVLGKVADRKFHTWAGDCKTVVKGLDVSSFQNLTDGEIQQRLLEHRMTIEDITLFKITKDRDWDPLDLMEEEEQDEMEGEDLDGLPGDAS